ncbi:MAG: rhodanese-like domain-containing protein, partial [Desulfococcaceae bacterium]|nr:rhodanese-like domain-containing protein [Desulfococcaceae bacterium]
RGIDGWKDAGLEVSTQARVPEPVLYQAASDSTQLHKLIDGDFVYKRLGDPLYQIIDVRSKAEYIGEKGTKGLRGELLKLGHIPTAVNINYENNWTDAESKSFKSYAGLQELYRGLDSAKGVIVYCNSGRRSAFSYFVLRLMGFENVFTYEPSWKEWGLPEKYYPVETLENRLTGKALPEPGQRTLSVQKVQKSSGQKPLSGKPSGGYVSCGG